MNEWKKKKEEKENNNKIQTDNVHTNFIKNEHVITFTYVDKINSIEMFQKNQLKCVAAGGNRLKTEIIQDIHMKVDFKEIDFDI